MPIVSKVEFHNFFKYFFFTFIAAVNVRAEYFLIQWLYTPSSFTKRQTHFSC